MLCWKPFAGQHVLANNTQSIKGPMWCKWQPESLGLRQRWQHVPVRQQTARRITTDAYSGRCSQNDSVAASPRVWSVEEVLDIVTAFSNEDLQRLKDDVIELAKSSARATPPPELAEWNINLVPTSPDENHDYFNHYMLGVRGQEYRVKASYSTWRMAAGTAENRCGRFQIADLLKIEGHTFAEDWNTCFGYRELQRELGMSFEQLNVLLWWLFEIIGSNVDLSLVEQAWEYSYDDEDDDEDEYEEEEEEEST